jgi:hypothetical protein
MISLVFDPFFSLLGVIPLYVRIPITLLVAVAILNWIYTKVSRGNFDIEKFRKLPGPTPLPLLGNILEFTAGPTSMLKAGLSKYTCIYYDLDRQQIKLFLACTSINITIFSITYFWPSRVLCNYGDPTFTHTTFAQRHLPRDICPEQHLPRRHLPRRHLPRKIFA